MSFARFLVASAVITSVLGAPLEERANPSSLQTEITAVHQANTAIDRYNLLGPNGLEFSFLDSPSAGGGGKDGALVSADDTTFPGVIGQGSSMLMGFLGPCGMIPPHSHPRATELLLNIAGPPLMTGIIPENGAPGESCFILGFAGPGNLTVLPQGSVHYITNTGCDPAVVVSGFNSESPGLLLVSSAFAAFDEQTYSAAFGGIGVTMLASDQIPNPVNIGRDDCLKKCGINRATFNINSVPNSELLKMAYAAFLKSENYNYNSSPSWASNSTNPPSSSSSSASASSWAPSPTQVKLSSNLNLENALIASNSPSSTSGGNSDASSPSLTLAEILPYGIALIVATALILLFAIGAAVFAFSQFRGRSRSGYVPAGENSAPMRGVSDGGHY